MIHYEAFSTYERDEVIEEVTLDSEIHSDAQWEQFLDKYRVSGKLTNESTLQNGALVRKYEKAGRLTEITLMADGRKAEIKTSSGNLPAILVGFHRIRGFEGPWQYWIYGALLDVVGISLILFAITGTILWMKLLKNSRIAWIIFIAGFIYVAAVFSYLSMV